MRTRIQGTKEETCWSETSENGESSPSPDICGNFKQGSLNVSKSVLNDATHCEITQLSSTPDNHEAKGQEESPESRKEKNFRFHHENSKLSPAEEELFNLIGDSSMGMGTRSSTPSESEAEGNEKVNQELSTSNHVQDGNVAKNSKSEIERMNESLNHMPMEGEENGKSGMEAHQDTLSLIDLIESNIQLCDIDIQELAEIPNEPTLIEESLNEDIELDMFIDNVIPMIVNEISDGDEETSKTAKTIQNNRSEMMTLNCVNFISSESRPNGLIIMPESCLIQFALIPPTVSLIQQVQQPQTNNKIQMIKHESLAEMTQKKEEENKMNNNVQSNNVKANSNVKSNHKTESVKSTQNGENAEVNVVNNSEDEIKSLYSRMKDDPKRFRCELCFSTFTDFSLLLHHLNCHSGKADDFKYACKVCPTRFQSQRDVKMHFDYKHSDPMGVSTRYRSNRADLKPLLFKKFAIKKDFKTVIEDTKLFEQGKTNGIIKPEKSLAKVSEMDSKTRPDPKRIKKDVICSKEKIPNKKEQIDNKNPNPKANPKSNPNPNQANAKVNQLEIPTQVITTEDANVKGQAEDKKKVLPPSVQPPASNSKMSTRSQNNIRNESLTQITPKGFIIKPPTIPPKETKEIIKIPEIKRKINLPVTIAKEELFKNHQQRRKPAILSHPAIKHTPIVNKPCETQVKVEPVEDGNKRKTHSPLTCDCKKEFPNKKRLDSHKRSIKKCAEPDPKEKKAIAEESQKEMENILRIIMREREKAEAEGIPIYNGKKQLKKGPDFNQASLDSSAKIKCGCGTRTRSKEELKRKRKEISPPPSSSKKIAKEKSNPGNKINKPSNNQINNNNCKRRNCPNNEHSNPPPTTAVAVNKNPPKPPQRRSRDPGKKNNVNGKKPNYSTITTTTTISSSTDLPIKFIIETKNNFCRKDDKENTEEEEKEETEEKGKQMVEDDTDSDEDDEYEDEDEYGEFKCFQCGIIFDSEVYYNRHFQHVHSQKLACGYCNKEYECKYLLRIHINEVHVESEIESGRLANFECPHCGKKIKFIKNYELHMNWHERRFASKMQDAPFKCHVCGVIVKSREFYPEHFKSKTHQDFLKVYNKGD